MDERFNQTLQRQLIKVIKDEQDQWDLFLDAVLFSYRVSRQDSTKYSPFYLMYGRNAILPVEFNMAEEHKNESEEELENTEELDLDEHVKKMMTVRKRALENIRHAQDRQKRCYDAKHAKDKSKYKVGILVWVKNSKKLSRKGSKLEKNWLGPYRICEVIGKGTFRLCNRNDCSTVLATTYNMTRLKLYEGEDVRKHIFFYCKLSLKSD